MHSGEAEDEGILELGMEDDTVEEETLRPVPFDLANVFAGHNDFKNVSLIRYFHEIGPSSKYCPSQLLR